jgi:RNA polymerase sigma-70 factor (ECF subfamily)
LSADEQGSDDAFVGLFLREYPAIVRLSYLMLGDRSAAEDIAQEAFLRLFDRWPRVSRYERPGAWVRHVAIRIASSARARRRAEHRALGRMDRPDPGPPGAEHGSVTRAILSLSPAQRAAVILHYYEDRPLGEVAAVLRCSAPTARVHLHRGRKRLGQILKEEGHVTR